MLWERGEALAGVPGCGAPGPYLSPASFLMGRVMRLYVETYMSFPSANCVPAAFTHTPEPQLNTHTSAALRAAHALPLSFQKLEARHWAWEFLD